MANIKKLVKKEIWTGKECGQIFFAYCSEPDKYDFSYDVIDAQIKRICEDPEQEGVFNTYYQFYAWVEKNKREAELSLCRGMFFFMLVSEYLKESYLFEKFNRYMDGLKKILPSGQDEEIVKYHEEFLQTMKGASIKRFFPETEYSDSHVDLVKTAYSLMERHYRDVMAYSTSLNVFTKILDVPYLQKWDVDRSYLTDNFGSLNEMRDDVQEVISGAEYGEAAIKQRKLQTLQDLFPVIEFERLEVPKAAISRNKKLINPSNTPYSKFDLFMENIEKSIKIGVKKNV